MVGEGTSDPARDVSATNRSQLNCCAGGVVASVGSCLELVGPAMADQQVGQVIGGEAITTVGVEAITTVGVDHEELNSLINLLSIGQCFGEMSARQAVAGIGAVTELIKVLVVTVVIDQPADREPVTPVRSGAYLVDVHFPEDVDTAATGNEITALGRPPQTIKVGGAGHQLGQLAVDVAGIRERTQHLDRLLRTAGGDDVREPASSALVCGGGELAVQLYRVGVPPAGVRAVRELADIDRVGDVGNQCAPGRIG